MALVAHYDLELHQMDVKTAFLNGNIDETIYMVQLENFESNNSKQLVCILKRSIYGLKQASRQWYIKFDQVITSFFHHGGRIHSLLRGIKPWDMAVKFYHSVANC